MTTSEILDNEEIVTRATEIYDRKYRDEYEREFQRQYVAIEVFTEKAYLGKLSGEAIKAAREDNPDGTFYLMRVGFDTTFSIGKMV